MLLGNNNSAPSKLILAFKWVYKCSKEFPNLKTVNIIPSKWLLIKGHGISKRRKYVGDE